VREIARPPGPEPKSRCGPSFGKRAPHRARAQRTSSGSNEELLRRLYQESKAGWCAWHEKLVEEEGVAVTYSTLTRMLARVGHQPTPKAALPPGPMNRGWRCSTTPASTR